MRQLFRKPLIVFTPKSLLGHPRCVSTLDDLAAGVFNEFLVDASETGLVTRVLLCSGKLYYELCEEREGKKRNNTAIIRIEQLYPLRGDLLKQALTSFPADAEIVWVQEEPENMGAWPYLGWRLKELFGAVRYIGRPEDCCPATGSHHLHVMEQRVLVSRAFES
jgi:2-oxoglutarate dehydrogenase E1 component